MSRAMNVFKRLRGDVVIGQAERALRSEIRLLDATFANQQPVVSSDVQCAATPKFDLGVASEIDDVLIRARADSIRMEQLSAIRHVSSLVAA